MMGNKLSFFFALKCLIIKYPIQMLGSLTLSYVFTSAMMLKIIEGPVYYLNPTFNGGQNYNDYRSFVNCMWNMFVTMTTGMINYLIT